MSAYSSYGQRLASPLACLALFLALALVWFGPLDYRHLTKPDEGRYAEIPREMAVSGDWVTPRLNGIKYFEKPPLQYWATAAAYETFGVAHWTARLWTALTGFILILMVFATGKRLFGPNAGLLAAASLAATPFMVMMGQMNTLDMGLSAFLCLALCGLLLANDEGASKGAQRGWMLFTWASLSLAVLSKGLVALVLTGGTLVLYSLFSRDLSPWRRGQWRLGLMVFAAITVPWFVLVCQANPEFFDFFFIHEHFERFLSKVHRRYQPAWYFIPVFLGAALPWSLMLLHAWLGGWRGDRSGGFRPRLMLSVWALVVIGFFSASSSKLPSYILPMVPALALLLGERLTKLSRGPALLHLLPILALSIAALFYIPNIRDSGGEHITPAMLGDYAHWLMAAAAIVLAGTVTALVLVWKDQAQKAFLTLAVFTVPALSLGVNGYETLSAATSSAEEVLAVKPQVPADAPFFMLDAFDHTVPFYLERPVTLVAVQDELAFGLSQEPERWVPEIAQFETRWQEAPIAFAIMSPQRHETLLKSGLPMVELARDSRRVIVKKP